MALLKPALTLHLFIETPASLSFLLAPTRQLPGASTEAKLILRNFGGLLLATNLLCSLILWREHQHPGSDITPTACLCLATYHVWPIHRAWVRMRARGAGAGEAPKVLGGPAVHFWAHVACLGALLGAGVVGLLRQ